MKIHPVANLFPLLLDAELHEMAGSITKQGLLNPCVRQNSVLLDGRNRMAACKLAGVDPHFIEYTGTDPVGFIIAQNIARRHLDESQRAMLAARLANMREGAPSKTASIDAVSQYEAASMVNVSRPSVQRAKQVIDNGTPELVQAVEHRQIAVSAAARIALRPDEEQREIVRLIVSEEAANAQQAARQIMQAKIAAAPAPDNLNAEIRLGDAIDLLYSMTERPHLVVTDPPYGLEVHRTRKGGKDYADGADYSIDLFRKVCAALVERLALDAHLYVFTGYTHMANFKNILAEFFDVQDNPIIWVKDNHTMCDFSKWYPSKHEYILFAKMRNSARPLAACVPDVIECGRERDAFHSAQKPVQLLRQFIEQSSVRGEMVLDPFAGSGSTGVAAIETKRMFLGFECSEEWAHASRARLAHI